MEANCASMAFSLLEAASAGSVRLVHPASAAGRGLMNAIRAVK